MIHMCMHALPYVPCKTVYDQRQQKITVRAMGYIPVCNDGTEHVYTNWQHVWYTLCFYHSQGLSVLPLAPSVVPWWPSRAQSCTHSMEPFTPVASQECMVSCKVIEHTGMRESGPSCSP